MVDVYWGRVSFVLKTQKFKYGRLVMNIMNLILHELRF